MNGTILLIEDDTAICDMVTGYLSKEGFQVTPAHDGQEGLRLFTEQPFDLVILDIMMPKLDGLEVLRLLRGKSAVPVLIVSARDSDVDKAVGLGSGADDYLAKPFSLLELTARVKAAIRRATQYQPAHQAEDKLIALDLAMDLSDFSVTLKGRPVQLTAKEFEILKLFLAHPKRVYTKAQIYQQVWDDDYFGDENVINVHIRRLREKIEPDPSNPQYIKTLWGIGYRLGEF